MYYDNLVITVLADKQTQVNAIKGGQVSGLNVIDQTTLKEIEGAGFALFPHELDWTGLMLLDRAGSVNEALGKVEVRQAINYAIDSDAMLQAVAQGHGTVTGQIFPETSPGYDTALDEAYPFDPDKAKELLADAGYPDGFELDMPLLAVGTTTSFDLVKQYLGDVGITVNYTQLDVNTAINDIIAAKYAATYFQLQMDPTAWQEANFVLTEAATFNAFHQPTRRSPTSWRRSRPVRGGGGRRDGGAQQVRRRPGLVQPVVPRRGQLRRQRRHRRHTAERQRLPVPVEHQAEGLTRADRPPVGRRPGDEAAAHHFPSLSHRHQGAPMLRFVVRRLAAGLVLVVVAVVTGLPAALLSAGNIARNILGQQRPRRRSS